MSTQSNESESSDKSLSQSRSTSSSPAETWDVQVAEGQILQQVEISTIVQGLREGWLTLDDGARKAGEFTWRPIREVFARTFAIAVFIDTPRAYAREYGSRGGTLLAILSIFGNFLYGGLALFDLEFGNALGFAIGLLIAVIGLSRGNVLTLLIGLGMAGVLAGVPINGFFTIEFIFGLSIGTALSGLIGWIIGYGPGYAIGYLLGSRHRDRYQLPAIRQPVPDEIAYQIVRLPSVVGPSELPETSSAVPVSSEEQITVDTVRARIAAGLCPKCGKPVSPSDQNCPSCRINLAWARQNPEQLANRK